VSQRLPVCLPAFLPSTVTIQNAFKSILILIQFIHYLYSIHCGEVISGIRPFHSCIVNYIYVSIIATKESSSIAALIISSRASRPAYHIPQQHIICVVYIRWVTRYLTIRVLCSTPSAGYLNDWTEDNIYKSVVSSALQMAYDILKIPLRNWNVNATSFREKK